MTEQKTKKYYFLSDDNVFKIFFKRAITMLKRLIAMSLQIRESDVTNIKFRDPTITNDFKKSKNSILDLLVEINHSKIVNIEMQNSDNKNTTQRFTWHLCNKYTENLDEGEDYSKLNEVHGIYLLNYNDKNYPNFFSKYESHDIMNVRDTNKSLINMSVYNLSKMRDIDKYNFSEEEKDLIRLIQCKDEEELRELAKKSYDLEEAIRILDEINSDKELRAAIYYERRRKHDEAQARSDRDEAFRERDIAVNNLRNFEDKIKKEKEKAQKKFEYETKKLKKEFSEELKSEKDNAVNQNKIDIAKKMLNNKEDVNYISEITGLPIKTITSL